MTEEFVPFTGEVSFTKGEAKRGTLIFRNDNPSGLAENQKELVMPVRFTE
jgi:hypothetical protein